MAFQLAEFSHKDDILTRVYSGYFLVGMGYGKGMADVVGFVEIMNGSKIGLVFNFTTPFPVEHSQKVCWFVAYNWHSMDFSACLSTPAGAVLAVND